MKELITYVRRDRPNTAAMNVVLAAACAVIVWKTRRTMK
jgi:hypothetical protein